jgi:hypothetical protein
MVRGAKTFFTGTGECRIGPEGEKGIDVWLSLEAYELAIYKRFDVSALLSAMVTFYHLFASSILSVPV